jgi:cytochrome c oxidase cbb3-type subunit I/II
MWKEFTEDGLLRYPNFIETVTTIIPMYITRSVGGFLYLVGTLIMIYNLVMTARKGSFVANEEAEAVSMTPMHASDSYWHRSLERKPVLFTGLALVVILIGGAVEILPTILVKSNIPTIATVKPYTPLELHGRDLYIREGCVGCHSQLVRPFRSETERYGEYSKAGEYVYDHPFLWGSKRTGPDLHRIGKKYSDSWHYQHMLEPTLISPGSIMPAYGWLFTQSIDTKELSAKISTLRTLGVPYETGYESIAEQDLWAQADQIVNSLKKDGIEAAREQEIVALIAYLQRLGTDIKLKEETALNQ